MRAVTPVEPKQGRGEEEAMLEKGGRRRGGGLVLFLEGR